MAVHGSLPTRVAMIGAACALVLCAAVAVLLTGVHDRATALPPALQAEVAAGRTASRLGIDTYLDVGGGWMYQVLSANRQETWGQSHNEVRAKAPGDELLVVRYRSTGPKDGTKSSESDPVELRDESGRSESPSMTSFTIGGDESRFEWIFAVSESAKQFTLVFPSGATVDLRPVMSRES